jgi:hypothetical protein
MEGPNGGAPSTKSIVGSWDLYVAEILSITARSTTGRPGIEEVMRDTIDISEWLDFRFYDYVWYWDEKKVDMTNEQRLIGRWLGIAHRIGRNMTYWILKKAGHVIARSTVQHVITSDVSTAIELRLADANFIQVEPGIYCIHDQIQIEELYHGNRSCSASVIILAALPTDQSWMPEKRARGACQRCVPAIVLAACQKCNPKQRS